jgi:tetratricopeptide (TPR) repeat protein
MRGLWIGLSLALIFGPAWAQTQQQRDWCFSPPATDDQRIDGCTAVVQSGHETPADQAVAYFNRANHYDSKGLHDQAIADYTRAIALKPDYAAAYNNRAGVRHKKGEDGVGLLDAEKAVALAPTANRIETRAEIYEKLGRRGEAVADYRASLKLDPDMQEARDGLKRLGATP